MNVSDNLREPDLPVEKPKAKQIGSKITYVMNELLLPPPDYLYKWKESAYLIHGHSTLLNWSITYHRGLSCDFDRLKYSLCQYHNIYVIVVLLEGEPNALCMPNYIPNSDLLFYFFILFLFF